MANKFTLVELRHAHMICFPADFERLYHKHAGRPLVPGSTNTVLGFLREYGAHGDQLQVLEWIVQDLLAGSRA